MLYVLYSFLLTYLLWLFYLAVMALERARDGGTLSKTALVLGIPILCIGYFLDFSANVMVCTPLFLELPKEALVTQRLRRHISEESDSWRKKLAAWLCTNLLDTFDPSGCHCKKIGS